MKKNHLIALLSLSIASIVTISIGVTYGAYINYAQIDQDAGAAGNRYIYLKPSGGNWTDGSAQFYAYYFTQGHDDYAKGWVASLGTVTDSDSKIVYAFPRWDPAMYPNIIFGRMNPNGQHKPSFDRNDSPQTLWGKTYDLSMSNSNVMYTITSLDSGYTYNGTWSSVSPA